MARTFLLEIVTPERIVLSEEVESVVVPAHEGYLGILAGHAPLLAALNPGEVLIRTEKGALRYTTGGGFVEAGPRRTVLLTESAEEFEEIDVERARRARDQARERLAGATGAAREDALAALARAENRLRAAQKAGRV